MFGRRGMLPAMSTIFVSGGSSERPRISEYVAVLRAAGWHVTYDWTRNAGWEDPAHDEAQRAHLYCLRGVQEARVFWYVAPEQKSEGSHAELGIAVATRSRIVASGLPLLTLGRVFHRFADLALESHGEMLQLLAAGPDSVLRKVVPRSRMRDLMALPR